MNLYIKINDIWYEPDIDTNENKITLDFVFDSLENPTKYTSEMSYTGFILPTTSKNNKIFDNLNIVDNTVKYNPLENIEYILISDGDTISSGTCYVESIDENNYNLSVNGSLYNIFSKLLNSGFRTDINDTEYYKIKELWKNVYLTPSTVNTCWNIGDNEIFNLALVPKFDLSRMSNTVGFMPTTFTDMGDFATDKWVDNNDIVDIEYGDLSMQQIAEFRVNKLKPYIYVDKLFQIYRNECKQITDYELILDERWFNESNEHLRNVVYVLPSLNDKNITKTNQYHTTISNTSNMNYSYSNFVNMNETIVSPYTTTVSSPNQGMFEYQIPLQVKIYHNTIPNNLVYTWNPYLFFVVNVKVLNDENTEYLNKKIAYVLEPAYMDGNGNYNFTLPSTTINLISSLVDEVQRLRVAPITTINGNEIYFDFGNIYNQIYLTDLDNAYMELNIQVGTVSNNPTNSPIAHIMNNTIYRINDYRFLNITFESNVLINNSLTINNASGSRITLERLFESELPFNVLLKYSKLLGLFWLVDDYNKTITVIRRSDYFYDCFFTDLSNKGSNDIYPYTGFYDITDLVDFTSFNEYPLSWNSRKVCLNFNESDNEYSKDYKEKYSMTFGSVIINTNNQTSLTTENLLCTNDSDTINAPIFSNEWIRPFKSFQTNRVYKVEDDSYLVNNDNLFMYRLSNGVYNKEIRDGYRVDDDNAYVILSSDSELEQQRNVYCYHSTALGNDLTTTTRPRFSETNDNGYSLLFAKPYEFYTTDFPTKTATNFIGLFESEYQDYFSEVYNADNKTLKIKALVSGLLYNRLKTVPFVVIGNVGYIILEISGWSTSDYCTLTLRQVNNIELLYKKNKIQTKYINVNTEM